MSETSSDPECGKCAEPAKVIIVTEASGKERRYAADVWDVHDTPGAIDIERTDRPSDPVARYAPGAWLSVREEGSEADNVPMKALSIARAALKSIASCGDDAAADYLIACARQALEDITDLDL
jgi:hypothetical protein